MIYAALLIGTLLGVRVLWIVLTVSSFFLVDALALSEAVTHPDAQAVGGFVLLLTLALVLLLLPSVQRYERRRIRLVIGWALGMGASTRYGTRA